MKLYEESWPPLPKPLPPPPKPPPPRPQAVTVERMDNAYALVDEALERVGQRWRERIAEHIAKTIEQELREGLPARMPSNEQQAMALIKTVGLQLQEASQALLRAAEHFKGRLTCPHCRVGYGDVNAANQTFKAHLAAKRAAADLIGD